MSVKLTACNTFLSVQGNTSRLSQRSHFKTDIGVTVNSNSGHCSQIMLTQTTYRWCWCYTRRLSSSQRVGSTIQHVAWAYPNITLPTLTDAVCFAVTILMQPNWHSYTQLSYMAWFYLTKKSATKTWLPQQYLQRTSLAYHHVYGKCNVESFSINDFYRPFFALHVNFRERCCSELVQSSISS